jgi:tRNA(fMet)-specific endonuclease VapC
MFVLDTDTLSLLLRGRARVTERVAQSTEEVAITLITRIEILQGRFASVLKAENGERLLQAKTRREQSQRDLKLAWLSAPGALEIRLLALFMRPCTSAPVTTEGQKSVPEHVVPRELAI